MSRLVTALLSAVLAEVLFVRIAAAQDKSIPVPTIVIYPGDIIKDNMLADREFMMNGATNFAIDRSGVVGKVARRTLLPGQPIPVIGLDEPKVVANGAQVKVVFQEGAITITTYGAALQSGGVGDIIRIRNTDSGSTISGVVQSDGSVRVTGG